MKLGLIVGSFSIAWSALISIAVVPIYVRLLGVEAYGLIGIYAALQAAMSLLDLGLGATINREVARSAALDDLNHARRLLRSLEVIYFSAVLAISLGLILSAPLVVRYWLELQHLDPAVVLDALLLAAVTIAFRWPVGLYSGVLIGINSASSSYRITAIMTTLSNLGAVLLLSTVWRSIVGFFAWQTVSALMYVFWIRHSAWTQLGSRRGMRFDSELLKSVLLKSVAMSGVAMSGLVLTQLDKFVVSSSVTLAEFGRYTLAAVLASGLSVVIIPTYNAIYPRLSALVATGTEAEQVAFYRFGTRIFLGILAPIALSAYCYSREALLLWTGDEQLAGMVSQTAGLLFLGSALNAVMLFPYALQLAKGHTKMPLAINLVLIAAMLPLSITLVAQFGSFGGALTWFVLNALFVIIGGVTTHLLILPQLRRSWLLEDVAPAIALGALIVLPSYRMIRALGVGAIGNLALGTIVYLVATVAILSLHRDTRHAAGHMIRVPLNTHLRPKGRSNRDAE